MSGTRIPENLPGKPEAARISLASQIQSPQKAEKPVGVKTGDQFQKQALPVSAPKNPVPGNVPVLDLLKNQVPDKTLANSQVRDLFMQTAANLGLPKDALSLALLVFARFFSLPLKPELIGNLRLKILESGRASSPQSPGGKAAMESAALAAVIAEDKGVVLGSEALKRYAGFFVPPVSPCNEENSGEPFPDSAQDSEKAKPEKLKEEEEGQKDDLLDLLNAIPGKSGRHWMVFPFTLHVKGTEFMVFLRILKSDPLSSEDEREFIADISGRERQWRFFVRKNGRKLRADIQVFPECGVHDLAALQKEARQLLNEGRGLFGSFDGFEEILLRNGGEMPSWVEDLPVLCLSSIDKDI